MKYEHICDYGWLGKGRKYWNMMIGNPFVCGLYKAPLETPREHIIREMKAANRAEKKRFKKQFPNVCWEEKK